jgi:hypothetical protein
MGSPTTGFLHVVRIGGDVTALWLMPFQSSPGRDDGYDVSDYYGVNPAYGTLGDFVESPMEPRCAASASSSTSLSTTRRTSTRGFSGRDATPSPSIVTGMFGQTRNQGSARPRSHRAPGRHLTGGQLLSTT